MDQAMNTREENAVEAEDDHQAVARRSPSADVVHRAIRMEGEQELARSSRALFSSGLAAGLAMGASLFAAGLLHAGLPDAPWRPLVTSLGYTVGFIFVVMGRQQLFTENTLTPIIPLLERTGRLRSVLRLWGVVLVANLLGALAFAWTAARTGLFSPEARVAFTEIARHALEPDPATMLLRAIVAGWLIALMVWLLPAAKESRLPVIVIPTYLIAVAHLAHVVVGSVDVFYLVGIGEATWADYFGRFLGPVLLGNVVGGVTLVAVLNHAQVVAGEKPRDKRG